jgi:hypothetical protein
MFLAMLLVCATEQVQSCEVYYNTTKAFVTQEACEADLDKALRHLNNSGAFFLESSCILIPGKSA